MIVISANINGKISMAMKIIEDTKKNQSECAMIAFYEYPPKSIKIIEDAYPYANFIGLGKITIAFWGITIWNKMVISSGITVPRACHVEFSKSITPKKRFRAAFIHGLDMNYNPIDSQKRNAHDFLLYTAITESLFSGKKYPAILLGDFNSFPHIESMYKEWGINSLSDTINSVENPRRLFYNHSMEMIADLNAKIETKPTKKIWGTYHFVPKGGMPKYYCSYELLDNLFLCPRATKLLQEGKLHAEYMTFVDDEALITASGIRTNILDHLPISVKISEVQA